MALELFFWGVIYTRYDVFFLEHIILSSLFFDSLSSFAISFFRRRSGQRYQNNGTTPYNIDSNRTQRFTLL